MAIGASRLSTPGTTYAISTTEPATIPIPGQATGMVRIWEFTMTLYDDLAWGSITLNGVYCWRAKGLAAGTIAGPVKVVTRWGDTLDVRNHGGVIYWLVNSLDIPDWISAGPNVRINQTQPGTLVRASYGAQ